MHESPKKKEHQKEKETSGKSWNTAQKLTYGYISFTGHKIIHESAGARKTVQLRHVPTFSVYVDKCGPQVLLDEKCEKKRVVECSQVCLIH